LREECGDCDLLLSTEFRSVTAHLQLGIAAPSPAAIHTIDLPFGLTRAIHVIAVITAQGENMKSSTETTETAPAATAETKATKKARLLEPADLRYAAPHARSSFVPSSPE
jgi:hypothetical protein